MISNATNSPVVAGPDTAGPTLILFCAGNSAEAAALAASLVELGVRLVVRSQCLADMHAPSADYVQRLRADIQAHAPAVVLATGPWPLAMGALTAALQTQSSFLYRIEATLDAKEAEEDALDRHATVAQAADCVLLNSEAQQDILTAQGVVPSKLHLAADPQAQADVVLSFLRAL